MQGAAWPLKPKEALTKLSTSSSTTTMFSPITSPVHEGITPSSSVPVLPFSPSLLPPPRLPRLPFAEEERPTSLEIVSGTTSGYPRPMKQLPPRDLEDGPPQASRWDLFWLWYNMYRRLWTVVTLLNLAGIVMAALGRFSYAEDHLGAMILGNLLCAILMRNELFGRFLYMVAIYGLRSVSWHFGPASLVLRMHEIGPHADSGSSSGRRYGRSAQRPPSCSTSAGSTPAAPCQGPCKQPLGYQLTSLTFRRPAC
jgi:hypothetical protein